MGKMKRPRQKLHAAAQKEKAKKSQQQKMNDGDEEMVMEDSSLAVQFQLMPPPADPTAVGARGENLFKGLNISSGDLITQKLPDFDARSSITSKTFRGQNLKKKEKQQIRKDAWMRKMDAISVAKKEAKIKKKKEKTPIVGDLTNMEDALPTLELLLKKSSSQSQPAEKPRSIPKEKKRKKQMLDDISLFHQVQSHPLFKKDAAGTIQEHLRSKIRQEREETMDS